MSLFSPQKPDEHIIAVAVQIGEFIGTLPPPARHDTLMASIHREMEHIAKSEEQGFLTSKGRFVSRLEATEIAIAAKQVDRDCVLLTSQHLW